MEDPVDQGWSGLAGRFGTEPEKEVVIFSAPGLLGVQSGTPEGTLLWMDGGAAPQSHKGPSQEAARPESGKRDCAWRCTVENCL